MLIVLWAMREKWAGPQLPVASVVERFTDPLGLFWGFSPTVRGGYEEDSSALLISVPFPNTWKLVWQRRRTLFSGGFEVFFKEMSQSLSLIRRAEYRRLTSFTSSTVAPPLPLKWSWLVPAERRQTGASAGWMRPTEGWKFLFLFFYFLFFSGWKNLHILLNHLEYFRCSWTLIWLLHDGGWREG